MKHLSIWKFLSRSECDHGSQGWHQECTCKTELFSFTKNKDWTQLERTEVGQNMVYTYAYNHILKPGTKTTTLFDTVTFANIIEGQLDTQQIDMPVRAYAIQLPIPGMTRLRFWSRQLLLTRNM